MVENSNPKGNASDNDEFRDLSEEFPFGQMIPLLCDKTYKEEIEKANTSDHKPSITKKDYETLKTFALMKLKFKLLTKEEQEWYVKESSLWLKQIVLQQAFSVTHYIACDPANQLWIMALGSTLKRNLKYLMQLLEVWSLTNDKPTRVLLQSSYQVLGNVDEWQKTHGVQFNTKKQMTQGFNEFEKFLQFDEIPVTLGFPHHVIMTANEGTRNISDVLNEQNRANSNNSQNVETSQSVINDVSTGTQPSVVSPPASVPRANANIMGNINNDNNRIVGNTFQTTSMSSPNGQTADNATVSNQQNQNNSPQFSNQFQGGNMSSANNMQGNAQNNRIPIVNQSYASPTQSQRGALTVQRVQDLDDDSPIYRYRGLDPQMESWRTELYMTGTRIRNMTFQQICETQESYIEWAYRNTRRGSRGSQLQNLLDFYEYWTGRTQRRGLPYFQDHLPLTPLSNIPMLNSPQQYNNPASPNAQQGMPTYSTSSSPYASLNRDLINNNNNSGSNEYNRNMHLPSDGGGAFAPGFNLPASNFQSNHDNNTLTAAEEEALRQAEQQYAKDTVSKKLSYEEKIDLTDEEIQEALKEKKRQKLEQMSFDQKITASTKQDEHFDKVCGHSLFLRQNLVQITLTLHVSNRRKLKRQQLILLLI